MNESIFGLPAGSRAPRSSAQSRSRLIEPPSATPARSTAAAPVFATISTAGTSVASSSWLASCEVALIAILLAPLNLGETAAVGFARKEAELRRVLAALSVLESRALQSRLSNPASGDQLVASFMRLTAERRARLLNFLADARRREATAGR